MTSHSPSASLSAHVSLAVGVIFLIIIQVAL